MRAGEFEFIWTGTASPPATHALGAVKCVDKKKGCSNGSFSLPRYRRWTAFACNKVPGGVGPPQGLTPTTAGVVLRGGFQLQVDHILLIVAVVVLGSSSSSESSRSHASAVRSRSAASVSSVRHGNCRRGGLARRRALPVLRRRTRAPW